MRSHLTAVCRDMIRLLDLVALVIHANPRPASRGLSWRPAARGVRS